MENIPCYICGKTASFWSSRFEQSFCSDICYSKVFDLLIRDYNFRINGEIEEKKPITPINAGDFKIAGPVVTLLHNKERLTGIIDRIDNAVIEANNRISEEDKMRKDLKKMGLDVFTIESMIKAKRENKQ
jgi:hypothetical protein